MTETVGRIAAIAARQHGVVHRRQLLAAGVTAETVNARLKSGALRRVHSSVYMHGTLCGPLEPHFAPEMAAVLACGPGAVVSRYSAAALLGLGPPPRSRRGQSRNDEARRGEDRNGETRRGDGRNDEARRREGHVVESHVGVARNGGTHWPPVDVGFPDGRTPARRPGIRAHRIGCLQPGDIAAVRGIPATSASRTICDLSAVATSREIERAVARAERLGLIDAAGIERLVERARGRRGARALRAVLQRDGGPLLTRSEAEARFLQLIRGTGLPAPEANVMVEGYEIDFFWRESRIAVEVDGFAYHDSRRRFARDRQRDGDLLGLGIRTMRVTWAQIVDEPRVTLVRLARAFGAAGGPA